MCRLFGFRSVIPSQVHQSLVSAENALVVQSEEHPDGWGVGYYVANSPHVIKSATGAVTDSLFKRVSGIVSSETVLAHVRKATHGTLSLINSHPFQYGSWIFAHNGNIPDFEEHREALMARIPPVLRRFILGDTDSEVIFYLLLGNLARRFDLHRQGYPIDDLFGAISDTLEEIYKTTKLDPFDEDNECYLSFLVTNGQTMAAHQGGKELLVSTYKNHCPERDTCPSYAPECEAVTQSGFVSHLLVSSEILQGENVWQEMEDGALVGVDWRMRYYDSVA
jgi:glutamine amidotransferase